MIAYFFHWEKTEFLTVSQADLEVNEKKDELSEEQKEEKEFGELVSNFPIRQSRSFDSGLPPLAPELSRLFKTTSARYLSARSSNTTTPSPRKQSIEDLASSVENLKEKLLLIPKDSPETIQAVKERLSKIPAAAAAAQNIGSLSRSRSWQGFSAAHRTSRQQVFWDSQRYESSSEKDLSLPPPPDKVPEAVNKRLKSSSPNRYTSRSSRRHYRPLSQSPSSSPARHHLRLSHLIPNSSKAEQARSSSLEGVDRVPKKASTGLQEKAGSESNLFNNSSSQFRESSASPTKSRKQLRKRTRSREKSNPGDQCSSCSSSEESDEEDEDFYNCVVYNTDEHKQDTMEEAMMQDQDYLENISEDPDADQEAQKRQQKTANQYFYRHHYLSIIQEEEENSDIGGATPSSSRASSRPGSIYGLRNLTGFKEPDSPKRSPKRKTDSIGSELSMDSVNSILSDEGSCKTYSTISTRKSRGKG